MRRSTVVLSIVVMALVAAGILALANWLQPAPSRAATSASPPAAGLFQAAPVPQDTAGLRTGISVTGEGSVTVKPDIARVTLGVEVSNPSANGAQEEAASKMSAVVAELKKQGIQEKDIRTTQVELSPDYDYSDRTPVLKGYRATNLVVVTVRDLSKVGGLLDAVVASGATRLHGIGFSVSDPAAAGAQGREEAMKNARAKADQLAKLAGATLGPPLAIEESVSAPPVALEMDQRAAPAAAPETPVSPGTQEIRTVVRVVYSIK